MRYRNGLWLILICGLMVLFSGCATTGPDLAKTLLNFKEEMQLAFHCPGKVDNLPKTPPMFLLAKDVRIKLTTQISAEGHVEVVPKQKFWHPFWAGLTNSRTQEVEVTLTPIVVEPGVIEIQTDNQDPNKQKIENATFLGLLPSGESTPGEGKYVVYDKVGEEHWILASTIKEITVKKFNPDSSEAKEFDKYLKSKCAEKFKDATSKPKSAKD